MTRIVAALLLSLALVLFGQAATLARAAPQAVGQMVLCVGDTVAVVDMDASGQPVERTHLCPDCATHLLALDPGAPAGEGHCLAHPVMVSQSVAPSPDTATLPDNLHQRGPPRGV